MPRVQYVSSRGIFHFHDTDAPAKTIAFDRSFWLEQTQRGANEAGSTPAAKELPVVRARVLNDTSVPPYSTRSMAPSTAIVDLTGDDDEPVVVQQPRKDRVDRAGTSSTTNTSKSCSTVRQSLGGISKYQSSASSGKHWGNFRTSDSGSRNHKDETIVLSDAEEQPRFKMPRGLETRSSGQSPSDQRPAGSSFTTPASSRPKRSLETDSRLSDASHPSKKRKVLDTDNTWRSNSNGPRSSLDSIRRRLDSTDEAATPSLPKPSEARKTSSISVDLTLPPRRKQKPRPVDLEDDDRAAPSQNRKSPTQNGIGDRCPGAPIPSSRRAHDRLLSSNPDGPSRSLFGSPASIPRISTPKENPQIACSQSTPSENPKPLHKKASNDMNDDSTPRATPGALSSSEDLASRPKKQAQRMPVTDWVTNSRPDSGNRTPEQRDRRHHSRTADQQTPKYHEKEPSQALPKPGDKEKNTGRDVEQQASAKSSAPSSTPRPGRKTSSDDDQGYVSLGSSNLDDSLPLGSQTVDDPDIESSAGTREQGSQTVATTLDSPSGSEKMHLRATKNPTVDKSPQSTGLVINADSPAAPEVTRPRDSSPKTPKSRENLSKASAASGSRRQSPLKFSTSLSEDKPSSIPAKSQKDALAEKSPIDKDMNDGEIQPAGASDPAETPLRDHATSAAEADSQLRSEAMQWSGRNAVLAEADSSFAMPGSAASALKSSSILSQLPLANQVERVLGKYLEELRGDTEYWSSMSLKRARESRHNKGPLPSLDAAAGHAEEPTSFPNLKPLRLTHHQKGEPSIKNDQVWGFDKMGINGKSLGKLVHMSAPYTAFSTNVEDVPDYSHYVSIKSNILAHNVTNLHCWPYFGDDYPIEQAQNLEDHYNLDIEPRQRKLLLLIQAQQYEEYVESAVNELDCSWADVLRFLLEPKPSVGADLDARAALEKRHELCKEDFSRNSKRWQTVLSALPASTSEKLARVAVLCENFQKMANFSLWHVARRSDFAVLSESPEPRHAQACDNESTCRICLRFNCPYHGQIKESPGDENDEEADSIEEIESVDSAVATDIVHPPKVNYRSMVAFPSPHTSTNPKEEVVLRKDQKELKYWHAGNFRHKADERGPFYPCHHPGTSCEDADCSCYQSKLPCEKICSCAEDCPRKFQGCSCAMKGQKTVCFGNDSCVCYQIGRECDPDFCGSCGVCEVLDPINRYDDGILLGRCRNASMQRGIPKHTLLGKSGVHGLGLYTCEDIQPNEFVGEYKGEIINTKEADRRGAVYEHQQLSYLFTLNKTQEIDSTYFGNKVRFINHAQGSKANLYPRIVLVNTVHRIALLANCHIRSGQELLFDYGPKFPDVKLGSKKSKKSAPRVRNANLVKGFLDVEELEDEVGNVRAKGVAYSTSNRHEQKSKTPRGGARPGAGRKPTVQRQHHGGGDAVDALIDQDAGERLAAFNISDDGPSDPMEVDVEAGADDDEYFEPEHSDSDGSEDSEASVSEAEQDEDEDEDEDEIGARRTTRRRRGGPGSGRRTYRQYV